MTDKNRNIDIMGIVNLTDNSYFADSRCLGVDGNPDVDKIIGMVAGMLSDGATIIDVGACSTRPGSTAVGEDEEWRRLSMVLPVLRESFPDVPISVDTYWSSVVCKVYDAIGNFIVNDISAGEDDKDMLSSVGDRGLSYIAMHKRGNPQTMQSLCNYDDVTEELLRYFDNFSHLASRAGIRNWVLDPGFGFAKTIDQNYQLMSDLERFTCFDRKILVGISRKSMIFKLFGITPEEALPQTQVLHLAALQNGADILRVHDVAEASRTLQLYRKL